MLLWDTFFDAGEAQLKKGKYGKAEQLLKSALGEANSFEPDDPRLLKTLLALISVYQSNKRPKEAEPHLRRAEELISPPTTVEPSAQSDVVRAQLKQLEFEDPDPHAETALRERLVNIWAEAGPEYQDQLLQSLLELTNSQRESSDEESAREHLMRALKVAEELGGAHSEAVDRMLELVIESFIVSQHWQQAEGYGTQRLEVQTALYGEDDPRLAPTLATQSTVLEKQRRMPEALPLIERAASIPGDDRTFYYLSFAEALLRAGTPAEALAKLITLEKAHVQGDLAGRYEILLLRAYQGVEDWDALREQPTRKANRPPGWKRWSPLASSSIPEASPIWAPTWMKFWSWIRKLWTTTAPFSRGSAVWPERSGVVTSRRSITIEPSPLAPTTWTCRIHAP